MNAKISLVGYTGFVGSNLVDKCNFYGLYNSSNIKEAFGSNPDVLIYAGLRAEKYIANKYPERDLESVNIAINNIKMINPKKVVLISTIDVYNNFLNVNEDYVENKDKLLPYGRNRLIFEEWIENNYEDYCIIRLPGLYGQNIKKNFIYDMIYKIPMKLTKNKYLEIYKNNSNIQYFYKLDGWGFYTCKSLSEDEHEKLLKILEDVNFSALNFTDSRGIYQFYNLNYLWKHIKICLEKKIKRINMATEPISIGDLHQFVTNRIFENQIIDPPPFYNFKTKHSNVFGGDNGYIFNRSTVLAEIKNFIESY